MIDAFVTRLFADPLLLLGLMSGLLSTFAFVPYIIDTAKGRTQPDRAGWLIWSVLGSIALATQLAAGPGPAIWFAVVQVSGTVIVFLQSITRGFGAYLSRRNKVILLLAAFGLGLWYMTDTPGLALAISIGISLLAGGLTIWKAFRDPRSETMTTWVVSLVAAGLATLAVGKLDALMLAYPLYLLTLYTGIVGAMILGRATGQAPYVETFVWTSRRAKGAYKMPPMLAVPFQTGPAFRRAA